MVEPQKLSDFMEKVQYHTRMDLAPNQPRSMDNIWVKVCLELLPRCLCFLALFFNCLS